MSHAYRGRCPDCGSVVLDTEAVGEFGPDHRQRRILLDVESEQKLYREYGTGTAILSTVFAEHVCLEEQKIEYTVARIAEEVERQRLRLDFDNYLERNGYLTQLQAEIEYENQQSDRKVVCPNRLCRAEIGEPCINLNRAKLGFEEPNTNVHQVRAKLAWSQFGYSQFWDRTYQAYLFKRKEPDVSTE